MLILEACLARKQERILSSCLVNSMNSVKKEASSCSLLAGHSVCRWWSTWWFVPSFWRPCPLTWALFLLWVGTLLAWEASWQIGVQHIVGVAPLKTQKNHDSFSWKQLTEKYAENTFEPSTDSLRGGKDCQCPLAMESPLMWYSLLKLLRPVGTPSSGLRQASVHCCLAELKWRQKCILFIAVWELNK